MKVVLIFPPELYSKTQFASGVLPPLGISYIAGILHAKGHEVKIIDAIGEKPEQFIDCGKHLLRGLTFGEIIRQIPKNTDLIGISNLFTYMWPTVAALAKEIKSQFPQIPIVLGGAHPSAFPEIVMENPNIDFIVISEGEETVVDLCEALEGRKEFAQLDGFAWRENGRVRKNPKTRFIKDLDALPYPKRDLLPMENYFKAREGHGATRGRWTTILASRGCPYTCDFCTSPQLWTTKWRPRKPAKVVDEIEELIRTYGIEDIHIEDDNLTVSKKWTNEYCDELLKRKVPITWQLSTGVRVETVDKPTLQKMYESGCKNITFAPESGNERVLKEILNKTIKPEAVKRAVKDAAEVGMRICLFFILGAPGETLEEARDTLRFARDCAKLGADEASFASFCPLPGSRSFELLEKEGKIKIDDEFYETLGYQSELGRAKSWSPYISSQQLVRLRKWAFFSFFMISFLYHPSKGIRTFKNLFGDTQETKLDRLLQAKVKPRIKRYLRALTPVLNERP